MCAYFKQGGIYNNHLHLRLPQGLFFSYFQTKIVYEFIISVFVLLSQSIAFYKSVNAITIKSLNYKHKGLKFNYGLNSNDKIMNNINNWKQSP